VLPNDTFFLSKQQYLALNVLFGLIILLATVTSNIVGTARAFWLTSAATVAAGVGEVITVLFMLKEMQLQGSMPWGGVFATQIAIILASPFILFFARKNVIEEIGKFSVISVTSEAFKEGDEIPLRYTCDGLDVSPPLKWSLVPNGTQTLALIVDDPDDSRGTFVHWVIYNMPKGTTGLPEDASNQPLPEGAVQGVNGTGKVGYRGPCPHSGSHRYLFKVYALDTKLDFDGGATGERLLHAMENHILAEGHLMGTYPGS
jgi:Raf kinase inhibitor-like YbhB/YbcL family protein